MAIIDNRAMQALRNTAFLARLVLAWFALSLGVALAAPLVQPQSIEMVCSGSGGMKLVLKAADGGAAQPSPMLDCPLCAMTGAPPPVAALAFAGAPALAYSTQSVPSARIAALTAAPLPARGPPPSAIS